MIGQLQCLDGTFCTVFAGIECSPHSTEAETMGCKEDVLSGRRAVLNPKLASFTFECFLHVAADDDGQRSLFLGLVAASSFILSLLVMATKCQGCLLTAVGAAIPARSSASMVSALMV